MSNEFQKDDGQKPSSIFVPIEWSSYFKCQKCGEMIERGLSSYLKHSIWCKIVVTEDAQFEVIDQNEL